MEIFKVMSVIFCQISILTLLFVIFVIIIVDLLIFVLWNYKEKIIKISDDILKTSDNSLKFLKKGKIIFVASNVSILIFIIFLSYKFKNILEGISYILINDNWISILIGITSLILPLVIYVLGESNELKKIVFITTFNIEDFITFSLSIFFIFFFNISPVFFIGFFCYSIKFFYEVFKLLNKLNTFFYGSKEFKRILTYLSGKEKGDKLIYFYSEVEKLLYFSVKNEEINSIEKHIYFWEETLKFNYFNITKKQNIINFIYTIQNIIQRIKNDNIFKKCSGLHIMFASISFENKDKENFLEGLMCMNLLYQYYYTNGEKKELSSTVINGMRYNFINRISSEFKTKIEEGIEWMSCFCNAINFSIEESVVNKDQVFFDYFCALIDKNFDFSDKEIPDKEMPDIEIPKEYSQLKLSNYFGIILLLSSRKWRSRFIIDNKEKIIEKLLNELIDDNSVIEELYIFIFKYEVINLLKWKKYFEPEFDIIYGNSWVDQTRNNVNKLFLELLHLQYKKFLRYNEIENETIEKMVTAEKENIISIFSLQEEIKKIEDNMKKSFLEGLFIEIKEKMKDINKKEVRESKLSLKKIEGFIKVIKEMLEITKVNKIFSTVIIIKEQLKPKHKRGYIYYLDKEIFIEGYKNIYANNIFEEYTRIIDDTLESIIVEAIYEKSKNNKINSLEELGIKNGIIIVSGIYIGKLFNENKKIKPKYLLNEEEIKKYGDYVEGLYDERIPIYFFNGEIKGIFILEKEFIQEIKFFKKENNESFTEEEIKKYIDIGDIGLQLEIESFEKFYEEKTEKRKEELLELDFLKEFNEKEEKLKHLKEQVLFKLYQEYEIVINEEKKVYQLVLEDLNNF